MRIVVVALLAFIVGFPVAARADLHVNLKGTNPAKTGLFDSPKRRPYGGCSGYSCHSDGGFVFFQRDDIGHVPTPGDTYVYALTCNLSVWKSGTTQITWHAHLYDASNVCTLRWANDNTIDVTIRN